MSLLDKCDLCEHEIGEAHTCWICKCDFTEAVCSTCVASGKPCPLCRKQYEPMPAKLRLERKQVRNKDRDEATTSRKPIDNRS